MHCHRIRVAAVLGLIQLFTLALGAAAAADDGRGCAVDPGRPACTILRPIATTARTRASLGWGQECIVIVGGLGTPVDGSDAGFFSAVLGDLAGAPRSRVIRFGVDGGLFDTTGSISRSGDELRRLIDRLSGDCDAIHVLAHSMGGVVADRALSKGDPAGRGVATYVALAGPHNGASAARAVRAIVEVDPIVAAAAGAGARATGLHDPTSAAVRDLARAGAPRPIRDVDEVRLRLVSDEFVLRRDNADRRFDVREYLPATLAQLEGHGGIVHNEVVQRVVRATIGTGRVPADDRSADEVRTIELESRAIDALIAGVEQQARSALVAAALAAHARLGPISAVLRAAP